MDLNLAVPVLTVQHMPNLEAKLTVFVSINPTAMNVPRGYFTVIDFSLGVDTTNVSF